MLNPMFMRRGFAGLAAVLALRPALAQGGSPARVGVLVLGSSEQRDAAHPHPTSTTSRMSHCGAKRPRQRWR
jgi:hypothetical protein